MNMPCISKQAYYNQVNIILEAEAEAIESWREIEKTYKMKTILIRIQSTRARTVMALLMRQSVLTVHGQKKDSPLFWVFSLL